MDLPVFIYHPDPLTSGSVKASDDACCCCGQTRGFIYIGPSYGPTDLNGYLCPWCIADGSAHMKFSASFADGATLTGKVSDVVLDTVIHRTPSFSGWQQEEWQVCCNDAASFLEPVGYAEIRSRYSQLERKFLDYLAKDFRLVGDDAIRFMKSLHRDTGPTAYIFQCRHCGAQPFYLDMV